MAEDLGYRYLSLWDIHYTESYAERIDTQRTTPGDTKHFPNPFLNNELNFPHVPAGAELPARAITPDISQDAVQAAACSASLPSACCLLPFIPRSCWKSKNLTLPFPPFPSPDKITPGVTGTTCIFHMGSGALIPWML